MKFLFVTRVRQANARQASINSVFFGSSVEHKEFLVSSLGVPLIPHLPNFCWVDELIEMCLVGWYDEMHGDCRANSKAEAICGCTGIITLRDSIGRIFQD